MLPIAESTVVSGIVASGTTPTSFSCTPLAIPEKEFYSLTLTVEIPEINIT